MTPPARIIPLWPDGSPNNPPGPEQRPRLEVYPSPAQTQPLAAVVVLPGGGYTMRAPHEGAPFADLFASHGMVGLVAHYRVAPNHFPAPMADAARAIRMTRALAPDLGIDPDRVALMGFSAGGHLAATTATQPDLHREPLDDLLGRFSARPDRLILGYPVISMSTDHHQGCVDNLLGPGAPEAICRQMSNDLQVTTANPPTFLFHTSDDPAVPVSNSIRFAQALHDKGVGVDLHVYAHGEHGVGWHMTIPPCAHGPHCCSNG